jgi:hypothetical protein
VTVTKQLLDPDNLVDDSVEQDLEFLIQITDGAGIVRSSLLYGAGESNTLTLNDGDAFNVQEVGDPIPNVVTVSTTLQGQCSGTVEAGTNNVCFVINTITEAEEDVTVVEPEIERESSTGNMQTEAVQSIGAQAGTTLSNLTVTTTVENNCEPKSACERISPSNFENQIFQFQDWKDKPLTLVKSFPGSATGWTTSIPSLTQYDVKADRRNVDDRLLSKISFSPECTGILAQGEDRSCVIIANLTNKFVAGLSLTVTTTVENNCEPKSACERISPSNFENQIFHFQDWKDKPLTLVKSFPGSATGWTTFFGQDDSRTIQYNVDTFPRINLPGLDNITYSPDCRGNTDEDHADCNINIQITTIRSETKSANLTDTK